MDYEVELAFVIGKEGKNIPVSMGLCCCVLRVIYAVNVIMYVYSMQMFVLGNAACTLLTV